MIRLGLIGCGEWGWRYVPSALEAGNAKVTHIARVSKRLLADENNGWLGRSVSAECKVSDDWESWIDEVDAVVVASPPKSHFEICVYLMELGKPVMVEKPMVLDVREAVLLDERARRLDVPFLVNNLHLFSVPYLRIRDLFLEKEPRKCRIYSRAGNVGPNRPYSALWDYGPHDVSMCLGLHLGVPTSVHCIRAPDSHTWAQRFDVNVGFGGSEASIQVWNGSIPKTRWFEVISEGMHLVYDQMDERKRFARHNGQVVSNDDSKPLANAVRAFADAVKTGKTDWRFGAQDATTAVRILHTADTGTVHA